MLLQKQEGERRPACVAPRRASSKLTAASTLMRTALAATSTTDLWGRSADSGTRASRVQRSKAVDSSNSLGELILKAKSHSRSPGDRRLWASRARSSAAAAP
jgi:hypothetical protein